MIFWIFQFLALLSLVYVTLKQWPFSIDSVSLEPGVRAPNSMFYDSTETRLFRILDFLLCQTVVLVPEF